MNSAALLHHQKTSLIGNNLYSVPYLSPFGRLYRLSRLNGLWLHQFPHMFGIPPLLQHMLRIGGGVPWEALHAWDAASSTQDAHFQCAWRDWYPYRNGTDGESATNLRGCPVCFAYGYHTMLHQLPWISSCPWHREPLVDSCTCGRNLLPRVQGTTKATLLACVCGKDHFDRSKALLGMDQWPRDDVYHDQRGYLFVAGSERRRTTLITSNAITRSHAYARIGPAFEMQRYPSFDRRQSVERPGDGFFATKTFDESTADDLLSDGIVSSILSRWSQSTRTYYSWDVTRIPITSSCYERIRQYASAIGLDASRRFGICDLVDINANGIFAQGNLIAEDASENYRFPRVDAEIIGERLGRLAEQLFRHVHRSFGGARRGYRHLADSHAFEAALFTWSKTPQARTLALALSEITTLIAIDHLRGLLQIAPAIKNAVRYRLNLGAPIVLVRDEPELKIIVGFEPPKLPSIASVRNSP